MGKASKTTQQRAKMQVPPAAHPAWSDLVTGKSGHQPAFLAARILLMRSRMTLANATNQSEAVRKCTAELRELFAQNADCPSVQQDLAKIFS